MVDVIVLAFACPGICGATISAACALIPVKKKNPDNTATLATPILYLRILYRVYPSRVFSSIFHFAFLALDISFPSTFRIVKFIFRNY